MTKRPPDERDFTNPRSALDQIKDKIVTITHEYSAGKINAVQFNAMYRHYMEKRTIIEKLLERNPETDAWRAASAPGKTMFLRDRFVARSLYYVVFRKNEKKPLMMEGKLPKKAAQQIHKVLTAIWKMNEWKEGLARKSLGDGMWLLLTMGQEAMTVVIYFFQPSTLQVNRLRDLHADFERANLQLLKREMPTERMVFPQRSLMDK
ncbi:MAG: hypothetical protein Q9P44_07115 [Anaerolineae bacterium]|nr:hypothetical protein [Anaerolineae bacterium]